MTDFAGRLARLPADTLTALSFFSCIPVGAKPATFDLSRAAGAWPIAGLAVAIGPAILFLLLRAADFPALVAAVLALALYGGLTGVMHEDGLADTFDGLGGGRSREARLRIMHDSRLGTYGVLALVGSAILKVGALGVIGDESAWDGAIALVLAAVGSRALALWHWHATMPARWDGVAWAAGRPDLSAFGLGLGAGLLAALIMLIVFGWTALVGILMAMVAVVILSSLADKRLGGHTGDTIGAAQQIAEALMLAGLSVGLA